MRDTRLSFGMACALVMGNMIGSGVFLLPASLAPFGWNAVVGWLVTIAGSLGIAIVLARLTQAMPDRVGAVALIDGALGAVPGFVVGWSYWVSIWTATATLAVAAVSYLSVFWPSLAQVQGAGVGAAILLIWLATGLNCLGARRAGAFQVVTLITKLLPLAAVLLVALLILGDDGVAAVRPFHAADLDAASINAAGALTLWAMLGFESASVAADKVENPQRTIPRATIVGTLAAGLIYVLACSAVTLMMPASQIAQSNAPIADFIGRYWGNVAAQMIAFFAAWSAIGALSGWVLLQGELPLAMAREQRLPRWFAATNAIGTPIRSLLVTSVVATALLLFSASESLGDVFAATALLSTSASLWLYLAIVIAALRKAISRPVALLAGCYAVWALWGAGWQTSSLSLLLMCAGLPLLWWTRRSLASARVSEPQA